VEGAIERAQAHILERQQSEGYWQAPLEANATMDAQYVFFNRFMGRERPDIERRLAERLLGLQLATGGWPLFHGGPPHLGVSVEALAALRMLDVDRDQPALRRAREFILDAGGLERAGAFTKIFLAYFGQIPWSAVPTLPAELMLVPAWTGASIYEMSSWARATVVPLLVLLAQRPRIEPPRGFTTQDLYRDVSAAGRMHFFKPYRKGSLEHLFVALDGAFKLWQHARHNPLRARAIRAACEWIIEHQERDGGWGGIQPPMVNSPMALKAAGYPDDHPGIAHGIQAVDNFVTELPDGQLLMQPCISPLWDTALSAKALLDSGLAPNHPALVRAAGWLMNRQICRKGDWSVKNPDLRPGGWAFEFENDWYPDVDDSAVILMVLRRIVARDADRDHAVIARGLEWTLGMQSKNGGWAAFDTDNTLALLNRIPFADMEAMIDPPSADITGRVLELMGSFGFDSSDQRVRRALQFVWSTQHENGAWWGRWGVNYIYGTWSVLAGLRSLGEDLGDRRVRRAVEWLKSVQHDSGGFGESCSSYGDASLAGQGAPTASQSAWAVLGLLAGEDRLSSELLRAIEYLLRTQRSDGSWEEEPFTGTGFPSHFYLRYWMYRTYFPLMALGAFSRCLRETEQSHIGGSKHE
jgi:squalene-hopene/tetraprenyl-beta-curcumene cyclase